MRRTDPLIVGGGPAGSAAAITLALAGAQPILIERNAEPRDTVCGAFVGWDALAALERLGIDPWALGAHPIDRVRIMLGGQTIERRLPRRAAGLSRPTLDRALLARAAATGTQILRGIAARRIDRDRLHLADGTILPAETLFIATGKYALRGSPRPGTMPETRVGLRTTVAGRADLAGTIELHPFAGGYAGLLLQEDGRANLCLSASADRLQAAGSADALFDQLGATAPQLADRGQERGEWVAIAGVPYGWIAHDTAPGQFRLGDQAAVIASVVGDGIAIALASGRAAGAAWVEGGAAAAPAFQRCFAGRARRPIAIAELARAAAERPVVAAPMLSLLRTPGLIALAARLTRIGP